MKRAICFYAALFCLPWMTAAHIGSPNVFYDGEAGPYPVRITIRPPGVVPGRAEIHVRILAGQADRVTVLPVVWNAGKFGSPPPDEAGRVPGVTNLFSAELWLMESGAYSVFVDVEGRSGKGTAIVPLNSLASVRLGMPKSLGLLLGGLGTLLFLLLVSIVGAAVRESMLPKDHQPDSPRVRKARWAMGIAAVLAMTLVAGGKAWWNKVDRHFRNNRLYQPLRATTEIEESGPQRKLRLLANDLKWGWHDSTPLVPDHGKIMHLFLIRTPGHDVFAHLHPIQVQPAEFEVPLPPIPPGNYRVFADVTHESGLTQTLISEVQLSELENAASQARPGSGSDADDSWLVWEAEEKSGHSPGIKPFVVSGSTLLNPGFPEQSFPLGDGLRLLWKEAIAFRAAEETLLRFQVLDAENRPAPLENYLGMASHAVVLRRDESVFTHLHPRGTISMTAQQLFSKRELGSGFPSWIEDPFCGRDEDQLTFPYEFPKEGSYLVWVQVRVKGKVRTGRFEIVVGN